MLLGIRHSHLRLFLISNFLRPVYHPRLQLHTPATVKPVPSMSSAISTTTSTMFRQITSDPWNRLHDEMQLFHNHFRHTFNEIYGRCDNISADPDDSDQLDNLLATAFGLYRHLDAHHSIEEYHRHLRFNFRTYIFPILRERMPHFAPQGDHLKEHEEIHRGLDEYVAYIRKCRNDSKEWDGEKMKEIMDSFREILFKHLDHEVESLSGEEMKKVGSLSRLTDGQYWKLEELRRIPM
jgi:Hemerythrin HHE cation binding domain